MTFLSALPKLTERRWLQQLIGSLQRNGVGRTGGLLTMFGWRAWHDVSTNAPRNCQACKAPLHLPRNEPGFPDLVLVRGDTLWFVELKADRGKLTDAQRGWLEALGEVRHVRVGVWRPEDLETITEIMR
jgi:hypothetical protein